jgi:hypothetical protein
MRIVFMLMALCIIACGLSYSLRRQEREPIHAYHHTILHALDDPHYHRSAPLAVTTEHTFSFKEIRLTKREKIPGTALDVTLNISLPTIHAPTTAQVAFNNSIYAYAQTILHNFFTALPTPTESKEAQQNGCNVHYDCSLSYQVYYATDTLLSVRLYSYSYTGGAHGTHDYKSVTYNLQTNKEIALSDLFADKHYPYLEVLSQYCAHELIKRNEQEQLASAGWIAEGTSAKLENYGIWNITPEGLLITYQPYKVAPYCAGMQQVLVPYSQFKQDRSWPLYSFIMQQ